MHVVFLQSYQKMKIDSQIYICVLEIANSYGICRGLFNL